MRCNPWRWLWGIIPIAMLSWITYRWEGPRIEADLARRSKEALESAGQGWAEVQFLGRDGVLSGGALEEDEPKAARDVLASVWGVRTVQLRTDLARAAVVYWWSAERSEHGIRLRGLVPNAETRRAAMAVTAGRFPDAPIDDAMTLARGAPQRDVWLARIAFALMQLKRLKSGMVELEGGGLSIAGEALDPSSFKALEWTLGGALPAGLALTRNGCVPPRATPFEWSAEYRDNRLVLSGHAPATAIQDDLFRRAKGAFPEIVIVDRTEPASGAAPDWTETAAAGLDILATLKEGTVRLRDASLTITGTVVDEGTAENVRRALKERVPRSFAVTEAMSVAPAAVAVNVRALETLVEADATGLTLSGQAPNEAARMAVVNRMRALVPDRTITDRLQLVTGASEDWQACILAGVGGLARLGGGRLRLANGHLDLSGETAALELAERLPDEVRSAARSACGTAVNITVRPASHAAVGAATESARDSSGRQTEHTGTIAYIGPEGPAEGCQKRFTDAAARGAVRFARASADLDERSSSLLDGLAEIVKSCPGVRVEISGHTDGEGAAERNQRLSERRAQAVLNRLKELGVDASQLSAVGYGAARPIAPNDTPQNRARNRRIEFTVKPN
jgi:outer membrane protein OmpA-like peptidoglycan-associated protein